MNSFLGLYVACLALIFQGGAALRSTEGLSPDSEQGIPERFQKLNKEVSDELENLGVRSVDPSQSYFQDGNEFQDEKISDDDDEAYEEEAADLKARSFDAHFSANQVHDENVAVEEFDENNVNFDLSENKGLWGRSLLDENDIILPSKVTDATETLKLGQPDSEKGDDNLELEEELEEEQNLSRRGLLESGMSLLPTRMTEGAANMWKTAEQGLADVKNRMFSGNMVIGALGAYKELNKNLNPTVAKTLNSGVMSIITGAAAVKNSPVTKQLSKKVSSYVKG